MGQFRGKGKIGNNPKSICEQDMRREIDDTYRLRDKMQEDWDAQDRCELPESYQGEDDE